MGQSHIAGWTPESPTPAQLAELFRQIKSGRITKQRLQTLLRGSSFLISTDGHTPWNTMVKAGGFDGIYINKDFNPAVNLPSFPAGQQEHEVNLRKQDETTTTERWLALLDDNTDSQERFAHPLVVLAMGISEDYRDEQREAPIFTIWRDPNDPSLLWYLFLYGDSDDRYLLVDRVGPNGEWFANYRAAVVVK